MISIEAWLFLFLLFAFSILLILFLVYSFIERERGAMERSIITLILISILFAILYFLPESVYPFLLIITFLFSGVIVLKFGNKKIVFAIPENRYDERDVMFSRNTLKEGTSKFNNYYKMRPGNRASDDEFRKEPGLLAKGSTFYNEILFNAANSTFSTVDMLQPLVEQPASKTKTQLSERYISTFIKNWALKLGAESVGFTLLKPHHIYTHIGRGEHYGKQVDLNHEYAIAFTVEMSHKSLSYNPKGPVVMESAQQYLNAGQIAVQLAQLIRSLGFEARAHIDANYRLICPFVAQDAGLGTIGRMGLLMTPKLGPRVRIGVVSTTLELPVNKKPIDSSVIHFCEVCKKCAANCPSQSVPFHSITKINNPERWTINQETCFNYWCKVGTDCARCVAVCPYSHPDNFFYGKKPKATKLRDWMLAENN